MKLFSPWLQLLIIRDQGYHLSSSDTQIQHTAVSAPHKLYASFVDEEILTQPFCPILKQQQSLEDDRLLTTLRPG